MKVNRDIQSTPSIYDKDYVTVFSRTMMICEMKYLKKQTSQFESLKYSVRGSFGSWSWSGTVLEVKIRLSVINININAY